MKRLPSVCLLFATVMLSSCKLQITVPEGGEVITASHAHDCASGKTCVVEVNDFHFTETFEAQAWDGWVFIGWKPGQWYLCQSSESVCHLSNEGLGQYEAISAIVTSDEAVYLEPEFVKGTPYDEALANVHDPNLRACLDRDDVRKKYAEQVRELRCGGDEVVGGIGSVGGIQSFSGIESLNLRGNRALINLQPLGKLSRLQDLHLLLVFPYYFNARPLGELKRLDYLELRLLGDDNLDLTEMRHLQNLRELNLLSSRDVDLTAIGSLADLKALTLRARETDISPLAGLRVHS